MNTTNEFITIAQPNSTIKSDSEKNSYFNCSKSTKISITILSIILGLIVLAGIVIIIIYAITPCAFKKCHPNAHCVNKYFQGECFCNYGYNGDGTEYCDECGVTYFDDYKRIVGGKEAVPHSWPAAVIVQISYKTIANLDGSSVFVKVGYQCGGTLIDRKTVLTAAHCIVKHFDYDYEGKSYVINVTTNEFYPTIGSMYKVFIGAHLTVFYDIDIGSAIPVSVEKATPHELYDDFNVINDIAILKLSRLVDLNEKVQVACLPKPGIDYYPPDNTHSWVVGWGVTDDFGTPPSVLNSVDITIYCFSFCVNATKNITSNSFSQICAGEYTGGKDSCQGDSGGSLFVKDMVNGKLKYISVGIVSYGTGCALPELPGVYTRVSYFTDWITRTSRN